MKLCVSVDTFIPRHWFLSLSMLNTTLFPHCSKVKRPKGASNHEPKSPPKVRKRVGGAEPVVTCLYLILLVPYAL